METLQELIVATSSYDDSVFVKTLLGDLINNVAFAVLLVMIVVVAILGLRSALLVAIAIPGSYMLGFIALNMMGLSANIVVLFSLILASGMLVDGAVVVSEYADRRLSEGASMVEAYGEAAKRMAWPIIASTSTTLIVFAPLLFFPGFTGQFMKYLPITLLVTLSGSLLMALFFVPTLGANFNRFFSVVFFIFGLAAGLFFFVGGMTGQLVDNIPSLQDSPLKTPIGIVAGLLLGPAAFSIIFFGIRTIFFMLIGNPRQTRTAEEASDPYQAKGLAGLYVAALRQLLKAPIMVAVLGLLVLVFSFVFYASRNIPTEFFPATEPDSANIFIKARGNLSIDEKDALVRDVEAVIYDLSVANQEFSAVSVRSQSGGQTNTAVPESEDTIGSVQLTFVDYFNRSRPVAETLQEIRERTDHFAGVQVEILAIAGGPPSGKAVQLRLRSENAALLIAELGRVRSIMEDNPDLVDIEDGLPLPGTKISLDLKEADAQRLGVTAFQISQYIQMTNDGYIVDNIRLDGSNEETDIVFRFPPEFRSIDQLGRIRINTQGGSVPISNLVDFKIDERTSLITRIDERRAYTMSANVAAAASGAEQKADSTVIAELTEALEAADIDPDVSWEFVGDNQEQQEAFSFLGFAFAIAMVGMFTVLITQFNSFYRALLILTAVAMSIPGVMFGLILTNSGFGVFTFIGVVSLAGVVVNNNIVLVDTFANLERENRPRSNDDYARLVMLTGAQRLRPVLITTVTTILGLLPLAMGIGVDFQNFVITGVDLSPLASLPLVGDFFASLNAREGVVSQVAASAQWWTGMSQAIAFGLAFSTMVSLFFTPCMLMIQGRMEVRKITGGAGRRRKLERFAETAREQGAVGGVVAS
ncbi:MAG: efflux RND transporter permease subunit [Rhodospirillaceae bacterium]|nr:MAG: efflux RND transporter permease subunit [Rhodospirillaceae bacterium]